MSPSYYLRDLNIFWQRNQFWIALKIFP